MRPITDSYYGDACFIQVVDLDMLLTIQVLPMEEREKMYRERAQDRAQRAQDQYELNHNVAVKTNTQRKARAFSPPVVPRTTNSFLVSTAKVRSRVYEACTQ